MKTVCFPVITQTQTKFVFKYENTPANAQLKVVFVEKIPETFHMDSAVGLTRFTYTKGDNQFRNAEIIIADYSQYGKLTDDEVFTSMLHELGHAIGLGHSNNPKSIMYPTTQHVKTMEISKEDLNLLAQKYHWR